MGSCCTKVANEDQDQGDGKQIRVESVTFYRSDESGAPSEAVDGTFLTTGFVGILVVV